MQVSSGRLTVDFEAPQKRVIRPSLDLPIVADFSIKPVYKFTTETKQ